MRETEKPHRIDFCEVYRSPFREKKLLFSGGFTSAELQSLLAKIAAALLITLSELLSHRVEGFNERDAARQLLSIKTRF
jgi:hypothetical protein